MIAFLLGIPGLLIHLFAGLSGMRLRTFPAFDALGAAIVTGTVGVIGHALGQSAVDIVLAVDEYALCATFAILAVGGYLAGAAASKNRKQAERDATADEDLGTTPNSQGSRP